MTAGDVGQQTADTLVFRYLLTQQQRLLAAAQEATMTKDRARDGDLANPNTPTDLAWPPAPAPASIPSPVLPGIDRRFRALVNLVKSRPGYTDAIGEALMIVGDEAGEADTVGGKPVLKLRIVASRVEILWPKGKFDALELQVDRGTGTFALLTIDTTPDTIDTFPFPATASKWKYRAIYRLDDEQVGQWSDVAEIMVG